MVIFGVAVAVISVLYIKCNIRQLLMNIRIRGGPEQASLV